MIRIMPIIVDGISLENVRYKGGVPKQQGPTLQETDPELATFVKTLPSLPKRKQGPKAKQSAGFRTARMSRVKAITTFKKEREERLAAGPTQPSPAQTPTRIIAQSAQIGGTQSRKLRKRTSRATSKPTRPSLAFQPAQTRQAGLKTNLG